MQKLILPVKTLRKLLRYEPETGELFWRRRGVEFFSKGRLTAAHSCAIWNARLATRKAFTATNKGYFVGSIFNTQYKAHRAIWAMETGAWPVNLIDHEDTNPGNNRFANLREATNGENKCNSNGNKNASSKYCGVSWSKQVSKWKAAIYHHGEFTHLGYFTSEEVAAHTYDDAARRFHSPFARLNFPD